MTTPALTRDNVPATLLLALGLWTGAVVAGTLAGVPARLPVPVLAALSLFATTFAIVTVMVDAPLRAWLDRHAVVAGRLALAGLAVVVAAMALRHAGVAPVALPGSGPLASVFVLVLPVSAALAVAAIGSAARAFRPRVSTAPARRPAAS